ncbi:hypothetical protein HanHA300_Chr07g0233641 [Helianthus annuus]|nr:hypothetical protein HanHA300_Chr07g0233641 [Helianthus annuus]KAJ0562389.1 hypothetical protein HanHA89_Chr07g0250811 [Helianthus annuus]KAJ0727764.1 hypothetical protein HanLR1_Chr07g0233571 [Helianthus annuus]KAJ0730561.1 hypothetical protein HanOQP8_Chr07g0241481 [Helianthus annuus]
MRSVAVAGLGKHRVYNVLSIETHVLRIPRGSWVKLNYNGRLGRGGELGRSPLRQKFPWRNPYFVGLGVMTKQLI